MTDQSLLLEAYTKVQTAYVLLQAKDLTHAGVVVIRDQLQLALTHIQGLENRFRQGLITQTTKEQKVNDNAITIVPAATPTD